MHFRTTAILAGVLAALGGLLWLRSQDTGPPELRDVYQPLFSELDGTLRAFTIENHQAGTRVTVENAGNGIWYVTEPVKYPADLSVVQQVTTVIGQNKSLYVDRDPSDVSLDNPRVTFEVTAVHEGRENVHRLELGARDLGNEDVHVRINGRVALTRANLENALVHAPDYYRQKRIVSLSPRSIIEIHRRGRFVRTQDDGDSAEGEAPAVILEGERDLSLSARLTPMGWRLDRPYESRLDPAGAHFWTQGITGLQVGAFLDDSPDDLAEHGLDDPTFEIDLVDERGEVLQLIFATNPQDRGAWRFMRVGFPYVFQVEERALYGIAADVFDLLDYRVVRARREEVSRVELTRTDGRLVLVRDGKTWRALEGDTDGTVAGASDAAAQRGDGAVDPELMDALLAQLETTEIVEFLPGRTFRAFEEGTGDLRPSFSVITEGGQRWGGELGQPVEGVSGRGLMFQRFEEDICGLVPAEFVTLIGTRAEDLWSPVVQDLDVLEQVYLEIRGIHAGEPRSVIFKRNINDALWYFDDTGVEAPADFAAYWIDPLLHMRSLKWIGADETHEEPIEVIFRDRSGAAESGVHRLTLGVTQAAPSGERSALPGSAGRVECESPAGRCEVRADLYGALRELLAQQ